MSWEIISIYKKKKNTNSIKRRKEKKKGVFWVNMAKTGKFVIIFVTILLMCAQHLESRSLMVYHGKTINTDGLQKCPRCVIVGGKKQCKPCPLYTSKYRRGCNTFLGCRSEIDS